MKCGSSSAQVQPGRCQPSASAGCGRTQFAPLIALQPPRPRPRGTTTELARAQLRGVGPVARVRRVGGGQRGGVAQLRQRGQRAGLEQQHPVPGPFGQPRRQRAAGRARAHHHGVERGPGAERTVRGHIREDAPDERSRAGSRRLRRRGPDAVPRGGRGGAPADRGRVRRAAGGRRLARRARRPLPDPRRHHPGLVPPGGDPGRHPDADLRRAHRLADAQGQAAPGRRRGRLAAGGRGGLRRGAVELLAGPRPRAGRAAGPVRRHDGAGRRAPAAAAGAAAGHPPRPRGELRGPAPGRAAPPPSDLGSGRPARGRPGRVPGRRGRRRPAGGGGARPGGARRHPAGPARRAAGAAGRAAAGQPGLRARRDRGAARGRRAARGPAPTR